MTVIVNDQFAGSWALSVAASDTIYSVKVQMRVRTHLPTHRQHLVFRGTELQDQRDLQSYGIQAKDCLDLVLRLSAAAGGVKKTVKKDKKVLKKEKAKPQETDDEDEEEEEGEADDENDARPLVAYRPVGDYVQGYVRSCARDVSVCVRDYAQDYVPWSGAVFAIGHRAR